MKRITRLEQFRPEITAHNTGRKVVCGNWSFRDSLGDGWSELNRRYIYHYETLMGWFTWFKDGCTFTPNAEALKHYGTVSDQQGMNKIVGYNYKTKISYGWTIRRDMKGGGARWEPTV